MFDAIVVGAGPAGLSAALVLGRCRRRVLVCDTGRPRNAPSHAMHGFLSRDGIHPGELLRIAREQLRPYESVEIRTAEVVDGRCLDPGFEVTLADGPRLQARTLLLATGVVDNLPTIAGFEAFYGRSAHHCPFCDGWEWRDQPIAIYGRGELGATFAKSMTNWSRDLVLCTDGPSELAPDQREELARLGIPIDERPVARLEGTDGMLERVVFQEGEPLPRRALFFNLGFRQHSDLAERLRCAFTPKGAVAVGKYESTEVPGLFVAGDASRDVLFAIVAAAEGASAAYGINAALMKDDLARFAPAGGHGP